VALASGCALITALRTRFVSAANPTPADGLALELQEALESSFETDAHFCAYAPVERDGMVVRLAGDPADVPGGVHMTALIGDLDDPEAHASKTPARPAWREEQAAGLAACGLAYYETRGGYRLLATLAEPFTLTSKAHAEEWKARYEAWCDEIEAAHGLALDRACKDWTRLYRLPYVERDGETQASELVGELLAVELPAASAAAADKPTRARAHTDDAKLARARALAEALPPSVEGHEGDLTLFKAASEIATVLGADAPAIATVLRETFNPRCVPPWDASKLEREARTAADRYCGALALGAQKLTARAETFVDAASTSNENAVLAFDTDKKGKPLPTQLNLQRLIEHAFGAAVRYEECAGRIVCAGVESALGRFPDGEWSDEHTTALVVFADSLRLNISPAMADRAISLHARANAFNALSDFLHQCALDWDGASRVDRFLATHWGAADDAASSAVARVFLLSIAARGLTPGAKVDTCPVFIGDQGIRKSSGLEALIGPEWFADSPLPIGDKDAMQNIRGKAVWEFGEHSAVSARERNTVKAFLSQRSDRFRASYGRHTVDVPRSCTFASSSNDDEILNDPTGARRFMPVRVVRVDVEAIRRDRIQILGEAAFRVLEGEQHWPTPEEDAALKPARESATESDVWDDAISAWVAKQGGGRVTLDDLFLHAVPMDLHTIDKRSQMRAADALKRLGWHRVREMVGGKRRYFYRPR